MRGSVPPFRRLAIEGSLDDLERGKVAMSLNEPRLTDGTPCVVEGPLTVRGWAHAHGGIEAVLVFIDGVGHEALRPIVRTDLMDYYGIDAAREGGFALRLHASECPPGLHGVVVVAIGREGDSVGVEGEIQCQPDRLQDDAPPGSVAAIEWIDERATPTPNQSPDIDPAASAEMPVSRETVRHLHGLALMWESRALIAEADAAASRVEAGLASTQQEATLRALRAAEARIRELEASGSRASRTTANGP